jgi:hypothetical protein
MKKRALHITSETAWWALLVGLLSLGHLQRWQLGPSLAIYGHDLAIVGWWLWSLARYPKVRTLVYHGWQKVARETRRPLVRWWVAWLVASWAAAAILSPSLAVPFAWFRLARLVAYTSSAYLLWLHWRAKNISTAHIWIGILTVTFFLAWFGWWQFWLLPDTRFLRILGWDDHYFRLISTWLDPSFTGLGLVLGLSFIHLYVLSNRFKSKSTAKSITYLATAGILFLAACVALTYSRSSYLALAAWAGMWVWVGRGQTRLLHWLPLLCVGLLIGLIQIPSRMPTESTNLTRTYSTTSRVSNMEEYWRPANLKGWIMGDGLLVSPRPYVTVAQAQTRLVATDHPQFPDNILISFWRQLGIVGVVLTGWLLIPIWRYLRRQPTWWPWLAAVLIHSCFNHSLIQPFIWLFASWGVIYFGFVAKKATA